MNLLLASLRRVEVRIEPQTITEFLKWKNRMAEYNRGEYPEGVKPPEAEANSYLSPNQEQELVPPDSGTVLATGKTHLA